MIANKNDWPFEWNMVASHNFDVSKKYGKNKREKGLTDIINKSHLLRTENSESNSKFQKPSTRKKKAGKLYKNGQHGEKKDLLR